MDKSGVTQQTDTGSSEDAGLALRDLVVITGFSGAGKSTAMAAFEDEGYFCVDNLPSEMIISLVELFMHSGSKVANAAVVSDVRAGSYFGGLASMLDSLRAAGVNYRVLFLEADADEDVTGSHDREQQMPGGHVRGRPEGEQEAQHERVAHDPVQQRRFELVNARGDSAQGDKRLAQAEQVEMVDHA